MIGRERLQKIVSARLAEGGEPWLRYAQAADVLGVSRGTLEVWLSTKRYNVPYYKIGRNVLFKRSELERWVQARARGGGQFRDAGNK